MFLSNKVPDYEKYFSNIIDIDIDQSDEELLIWSDSAIKSIDVMPVEYLEVENSFVDRDILPSTLNNNIEIGEAIKVKLCLPCGIPSHKIVVTNQEDKTFSFIPSLSGHNSSLGLLVKDDFYWGAFSFGN